jgi:hypothetical protein
LPCHTLSAHLHPALFHHSIPIGPASAATTGGFVQTALSNARGGPCLLTPVPQKRASDKALTLVARNTCWAQGLIGPKPRWRGARSHTTYSRPSSRYS